jgi:tRNA threonylcarbamoyladenosine biosynthesis protein TsaE
MVKITMNGILQTMTDPETILTLDLKGVKELASKIAKALKPRDVLCLWGTLGAGKTEFARALIQSFMSSNVEVLSPTFTLVQTYDTANSTIWHYDLYRLKSSDEIIELGIEEAFSSGISVIEWPERLEEWLPRRRIDISLRIINEYLREITIKQTGMHDFFKL